MKDQVYSAMYLLLLKKNQDPIDKLSQIMACNQELTLADLKISRYFQFDREFRRGFALKEGARAQEEEGRGEKPFAKSIMHIAQIRQMEQPTEKLEHIYGLNKIIIGEIDEFWAEHSVPAKHLSIDTDNLLGVYIYCLIRSNFPQILVEIEIANEFLTNIAKLSNKGTSLSA